MNVYKVSYGKGLEIKLYYIIAKDEEEALEIAKSIDERYNKVEFVEEA